MPDFIMMVGVPGSGKSTWLRENFPHPAVYCSTDALIDLHALKEGKTYNEVFRDYIETATDKMQETMDWAFERGMDVVLDQTNLTRKSRARKLALVPKGYRKVAVVVPTPEREEWLRRLDRPGKTIPRHVLEAMLASYQEPSLDEGFDEIRLSS